MRRVLLASVLVLSWGALVTGSIQNFTGFEVGNTNELMPLGDGSTGTGTATVLGSIVRSGDWALYANCPATTDLCFHQFRGFNTGGAESDQVASDHYWTGYVRFATLPAANSEPFWQSRSSADALKAELRIDSAGHLQAYNSAGTTQLGSTGTATLTTGVWYCLQVRVGIGTSGAPFVVTVDAAGSPDINTTGNLLAGGTARTRLGKAANRNSQAMGVYFDDVITDNASQPACGQQILHLGANGNGTAGTAWTVGAGAGADWQLVNQIPSDGSTTYLLSTSVDGDTSAVTVEPGSSAGVTGTVAAVKAFAFFRRDSTAGGATGTIQLGIRSNGADSLGVDSIINPATVGNFDPRQLIFTTDPNGGGAWTLGAMDTLEVLAVEAETTDKTRVTAMNMHVLFTPGGGGGGGGGALRGLLLMGLGGAQ